MSPMPVYEYACTSCGERTEAKQSFHDVPLQECPHCGGSLRKLYSPVGIVFRGSGFYSTDSRRKPASDKKGDAAPKKEASTDSSTGAKEGSTAKKEGSKAKKEPSK